MWNWLSHIVNVTVLHFFRVTDNKVTMEGIITEKGHLLMQFSNIVSKHIF